MTKMTFNSRLQLGKELLKYIKDTSTDTFQMTVKQLELIYANNFKDLQFTSGVSSLPPFITVLEPLKVTHKIEISHGFVHIGRQRKSQATSSKKQQSPVNGEHSEVTTDSDHMRNSQEQKTNVAKKPTNQPNSVSNAEVTQSSSSKSQKRRRRRHGNPPTTLAVDQHLVIDKAPDNKYNSSEPIENKLPRFIHMIGNLYQCVVCAVSCTSNIEMEKHVSGRRHRIAEVMHGLRNKRDELVQDKGGIVIESEWDLQKGIVEISVDENEVKKITINIKNTNQKQSVIFAQCEMLKRIRIFQLDDKYKVTEGKTAVLSPGMCYSVSVRTYARNVGSFHTPLAFYFKYQDCSSDPGFHIVRYLHAHCQNKITKSLKPTQKYKRPPRRALKKPASQIIDGFKLPSVVGDLLKREFDLKPYYILDSLRHIINRGLSNTKGLKSSEKIETSALRTMLEGDLTMSTYQKRLSCLMHCEEIQMEVDIRQYDIEEATMTVNPTNTRLMVLKVPGLSENRPSVLRGDWLFIHMVDSDDREYKGYVHDVHQHEVVLGFHKSLLEKITPTSKFNVRFVFNRLPTKLQHRACEIVNKQKTEYKKLLFPSKDMIGSCDLLQPLNTQLQFYSKIPVNTEQATAIKHIVAGTSRPAPYLVFGPPGTGKTFTIVEAMKQVLTCLPKACILACTPSNNAADLITERLLDDVNILGGIIRLNAVSRNWKLIPERIKKVCNYNHKSGSYYFPSKDDLMKYRVIICTAVTSGRIASARFPKGHFTHIFLDEAGHALEPEALIPVTNILNVGTGQLVLAGDQKQLGPILRSPFAIKYGLNISLLERYMIQEEIYDKMMDESGVMRYNPNVLTKLVKNYRSHHSILHHPNNLFYDGELEAYADASVANFMCGWECLPNKDFPIIFHAVYGEELREERSPSFFNPEEAYLVLQYVKDLKKLKGKYKLEDQDIGIITPYQRQVKKIQRMMLTNKWKNIRVGSVEEFQGQERKVIIVSTVRSNPDFLSLDINFKLGFLRNPKRFNVTVTRAKALLIIIGNPNILSLDDTWNSFIEYVNSNGGVVGENESLDSQDDMIDDIIQRLKTVKLFNIDIETASHFNEQSWHQNI